MKIHKQQSGHNLAKSFVSKFSFKVKVVKEKKFLSLAYQMIYKDKCTSREL